MFIATHAWRVNSYWSPLHTCAAFAHYRARTLLLMTEGAPLFPVIGRIPLCRYIMPLMDAIIYSAPQVSQDS